MGGFTHKSRQEVMELTTAEMKLVPELVALLNKHQGIANRISRRELEGRMIIKGVGPERLTDFLRHIRTNSLVSCLVSYRKGYYVATTRSDIADYIGRLDRAINDHTKQAEELCTIKENIMKQCVERFGK